MACHKWLRRGAGATRSNRAVARRALAGGRPGHRARRHAAWAARAVGRGGVPNGPAPRCPQAPRRRSRTRRATRPRSRPGRAVTGRVVTGRVSRTECGLRATRATRAGQVAARAHVAHRTADHEGHDEPHDQAHEPPGASNDSGGSASGSASRRRRAVHGAGSPGRLPLAARRAPASARSPGRADRCLLAAVVRREPRSCRDRPRSAAAGRAPNRPSATGAVLPLNGSSR
jgi:hypothetical protein